MGAHKRTIFHNELPALFRRAGNPAPAPVRSSAGVLSRGAHVGAGRRALRLLAGRLSGCCATPFDAASCRNSSPATRPVRVISPRKARLRSGIIALRKRNYSVYDIIVRSSSKERRSALPRCARCWRRRALRRCPAGSTRSVRFSSSDHRGRRRCPQLHAGAP